jgi:signal transduction histidine kinase
MSLSVVVFTLAGSVALAWWFHHRARLEARDSFASMAAGNAAFLGRTGIEPTANLARQLAEVTGVGVWFRVGERLVGPVDVSGREVTGDGEVRQIGDEWLVGHRLEGSGAVVCFAAPAEAQGSVFGRADSWWMLGGFWLLSLVLGIGLARRVARPVEQLARAVPAVGADGELPALPVERSDEIGELARSLAKAHETLLSERGRREEAERMAILGRMAAGLAHEVRNPVTAIRLHAQLLADAKPEDAAESRRLIEGEAERIESLVGQWLRFARPAPPVLAKLDLREVVQRGVRTLSAQANYAGVELVTELPDEAVRIEGDGERLAQAMANLLLNAIQAMPRGGEVRVAALGEGGKAVVVVEDRGGGFSEKALQEAGEAFFSEKEGGMGLGLAVVQEICRGHGGELRWENRDEGGARVSMRLPLSVAGTSRFGS